MKRTRATMAQGPDQSKTCAENEERLRCLSEASFEGLVIHEKGRVIEINGVFSDMFGYKRPEIIGMHTLEFTAPESRDKVLLNIISGDKGPYKAECLRKDGSTFTAEVRSKDIRFQGRTVKAAAMRDITGTSQTEEGLRKSHANLSTLFRVSAAINQTIDLNKLFDIVLETVTGLDIFNAERKGGIFIIEGNRMKLVSHLGHPDIFLRLHKGMKVGECLCGLAAKTGGIIISGNSDNDVRHTVRYPGMHSHGHIIIPLKARYTVVGVLYLYLPADFHIDENGINLLTSIGNQIGIAIDNAKLYEETRSMSLLDPLTKLANRRMMDIFFEKYVAGARRSGTPLSVIMLDIDRFKEYNDAHGHSSGDRLLVNLAKLLLDEIREVDIAVRYGGEEFLVLFPETELSSASAVAERIRKTAEATLSATVSIGVASYSEKIENQEELIKTADAALYFAKQKGRNRVETAHV